MEVLVSWLLSFLLFLTIPIKKIDNEFLPYYNSFFKSVNKNCKKISPPNQLTITFKDLSKEEVGLCYIFPHKKQIYIDKFFWEYANDNEKKQLIYHELTHCILNIHHVSDKSNYMNDYLVLLPDNVLETQLENNIKEACNE